MIHIKKKFRSGLLFVIAFLFFLPSCEKKEPDCFEPNLVLTRIAFTSKDSIHVDSLIDSVYVDTTFVQYKDTFFKSPVLISIGMPQNIMIFGSQYNNFIGAPFNPDYGHIKYALIYDTTQAASDTISYFYHSSVHFISNACGFTNFYHIDSVQATKHILDSVAINKRDVTDNASDRHVTLYFYNH